MLRYAFDPRLENGPRPSGQPGFSPSDAGYLNSDGISGFLWFEFQGSYIDLEQTLQPFFHLDLIIDLFLSLHEGLAIL